MPLDGLYAHLETDFMRSHKFIDLTPATRCLYLSIWCYALEQRREVIERPSDHYLTAIAGLKHHDCSAMLMRLNSERLLIVNEKYIAVVGLRKKHNKIKFKKEFENSGIEFNNSQDSSFLSYPFQNITNQNKPCEAVKPPPKVEKQSSKKPDSEMRIFTDWWCAEFESRFGSKYAFEKRDGVMCAQILKSLGLDESKRRATLFLDSDDDWICQAGKTIPIFRTKLNTFASDFKSDAPKISKALSNTMETLDRWEERMDKLEGKNE